MNSDQKKETIDDKLFTPLAEFLSNHDLTFSELTDLVEKIGYPKYDNYGTKAKKKEFRSTSYKGFILEAYVKSLISKFVKSNDIPLYPNPLSLGEVSKNCYFEITKWGNVNFYDPWTNGNKAELDGLYEFNDDAFTIPIMVEISFGRYGHNLHYKEKLVKKIYNSDPYVCSIRASKKNEDLGLHRNGNRFHRNIVIQNREEFTQLAVELSYSRL